MHDLLRLWDAMPHRVFSVSNRFDRIDSSFRGVTLLIFGSLARRAQKLRLPRESQAPKKIAVNVR